LANSEFLTKEQHVPDNLAELGRLTLLPGTNIIKLPNVSASVAQLKAAIKELQDKDTRSRLSRKSKTDEEKAFVRAIRNAPGAYNPVLREGNSDRRAPLAVKNYARKHPHSMGEWSQASRSHVLICITATSITARSR
jgi:isocitrate dehydrogenase